MPGPITHLKVAYFILENKIASVLQPEQFFLGAISPDSVNIDGHAAKEIRWPAHLRDHELKKWLVNVREFYEKEHRSQSDASFLLGYIIHIITDIVWDMYFEKELWADFGSITLPRQLWKAERWNELYGYERLQSRLPWFEKDVGPLLEKAVPETIGTLREDQVADWRDAVLDLKMPQGHLPRFIDDELIERFCVKSGEVFSSLIVQKLPLK